ncbi:M20/M25/M40 family metallo-hydrolase [Terriglobus tenax]|uniref:M20/M25/M40 family metallo-hydrolase n=1 Tax=Terriglobus tenax TaxID=1111115 RepID=UPI0021DF5738|nr:M20/M25/M40 family metallo-hydrolase [Terriglobus tenax]
MTKQFLAAAVFGLALSAASAQQLDFRVTGAPLRADSVDPAIAPLLRQVSATQIQKNIEKLVSFHNRSTLSSMETGLPEGTGITAAAAWIKSQFEQYSKDCGGCLEVKEDTFIEPAGKPSANGAPPRINRPTKLTNVYAVMKGTDPTQSARRVLVTGHYDTRVGDVMDTHAFAPGANDDSSGTAVSLECARVLSKAKLPATVIFVAVAGEEQGLNGSRHLAQLAKSEGWQLEAVLNNDIVGGNTTPGEKLQSKSLVRVFSENVPLNATEAEMRRMLSLGEESDSPSRQVAREVLSVARTYFPVPTSVKPVMVLRLDRYLRGGDHSSFNREGFAAVRFSEWREDFHHQHQQVRTENGIEYGDLLKFDDFGYIARVARLNLATLATMATAPGMPAKVRMVTSNLDNDSILKFDAPEGAPEGTWYQLVWRETNASDWQFAGKAAAYAEKADGATHTVTLPVSKDNTLFGVRACTRAGICSPAVAPL